MSEININDKPTIDTVNDNTGIFVSEQGKLRKVLFKNFKGLLNISQAIKDCLKEDTNIVKTEELYEKTENYLTANAVNLRKKLFLPYCNTANGSTGTYCKLFSIPKTSNSSDAYYFDIKYIKCTDGGIVRSFLGGLLIRKKGSAFIDVMSDYYINYKGAITSVITNSSIDIYAKGENGACIMVDVELKMYTNAKSISEINYDKSLYFTNEWSKNKNCNKWKTIDTTGCTVSESWHNSPLDLVADDVELYKNSITDMKAEITIMKKQINELKGNA